MESKTQGQNVPCNSFRARPFVFRLGGAVGIRVSRSGGSFLSGLPLQHQATHVGPGYYLADGVCEACGGLMKWFLVRLYLICFGGPCFRADRDSRSSCGMCASTNNWDRKTQMYVCCVRDRVLWELELICDRSSRVDVHWRAVR